MLYFTLINFEIVTYKKPLRSIFKLNVMTVSPFTQVVADVTGIIKIITLKIEINNIKTAVKLTPFK